MHTILESTDYVGISFWFVSAALLAATAFFFLERGTVSNKWKTSLTVAGLVTGIAFWHYLYMRGMWIDTGTSPTVYRYIDWLLTVPLLIIEFYFILKAVTTVRAAIFYKLLINEITPDNFDQFWEKLKPLFRSTADEHKGALNKIVHMKDIVAEFVWFCLAGAFTI